MAVWIKDIGMPSVNNRTVDGGSTGNLPECSLGDDHTIKVPRWYLHYSTGEDAGRVVLLVLGI